MKKNTFDKIIGLFSLLVINYLSIFNKKNKEFIKIILTYIYLRKLPIIYNIINKKNDITTWIWIILTTFNIKKYFSYKKINKIRILFFLVGLFLADLNSGLVHIYLDNSKILNNNSLVDNLRKGFQWHHEWPARQFDTNPKYRAHYEMNMVFPYTILPLLFLNKIPTNNLKYLVISLALGSVFQQTTHYWCHARIHNKPLPTIGKILQGFTLKELNNFKIKKKYHKLLALSLFLNPIKHQQHHLHPTYNINFCILNGWANPLLNTINFKYNIATPNSFYINFLDKIFK